MNEIVLSKEQIRVLFKLLSDVKFESMGEDYDKYVYSPIFNQLLKSIGEVFYENFTSLANPFLQSVNVKDKWKLGIIKKRFDYLKQYKTGQHVDKILEQVSYPFYVTYDDILNA